MVYGIVWTRAANRCNICGQVMIMLRKSNLFLLAAVVLLGALTLSSHIARAVHHGVSNAEHRLGLDWLKN
jgi:hypothetical protein